MYWDYTIICRVEYSLKSIVLVNWNRCVCAGGHAESFAVIGYSTLCATSVFHVLTSSMSIIIDVGTCTDLMCVKP